MSPLLIPLDEKRAIFSSALQHEANIQRCCTGCFKVIGYNDFIPTLVINKSSVDNLRGRNTRNSIQYTV